MMINKRLIRTVDRSMHDVWLTVLYKWLTLVVHIIAVAAIGYDLQQTWTHGVNVKRTVLTCVIVIVVLLLKMVFQMKASLQVAEAAGHIRLSLRDMLFRKLLRTSAEQKDRTSTAEAVQVAADGIEQLDIYFSKYLPQLIYSLLAPFTLFIVLSLFSWRAALVLMLCVPLIPLSIVLIMKLAKRVMKQYWGKYVNLGDTFLENLQALTTLKIYNRDEDRHRQMNEEAEQFRTMTMRLLKMQLNSVTVMDLLAYGGSAIGIIIAVQQYAAGDLSLVGAFAFIILSAEFFIPLRLLGGYFHIAMNGMTVADKLFRIMDMQEGHEHQGTAVPESNADYSLEKVSFAYDDRAILKDVDMNMKRGQLTAIVGESGSGKSTISKLLMGYYSSYEGHVKYGKHEVRDLDKHLYRDKVVLVPHNGYIFSGTIADQLRMGKPDATKEEMIAALAEVRLDELIEQSAHGLDEPLQEGGANLSGGQRQRLALARALLYDADVYIFDEATSNIDAESEEIIQELVYTLSRSKIVILISHRLVHVRAADCIYVMDQGRVVEYGEHEALMERNGTYAKLVHAQFQLEQIGGAAHA